MKTANKNQIVTKSVPGGNPAIVSKITDVLLPLLFILFLCLLTTTKIFIDNDVFWHLATGKYIIENKVIPSADVFGFATQGVKWIPFEWGWDIVTYLFYSAGGYVLLSIFRTLVIVLIFVIAYKLSRKLGIAPAITAVFGILLCFGLLVKFGIRPHLVSYFFITLLISILIYYRDFAKEYPRLLYTLPFIFLIWANMHMGVVLGIAIFFIFIACRALEYFSGKKTAASKKEAITKPDFKKMLLIFSASLGAVLINPFFIQTFIYAYSHTQMDTLDNISEWRSPFAGGTIDFYYVKIYLFFLIAGIVTLYYSLRTKNFFPAMLYIIFGIYSTQALRYTDDFMVIIFIPLIISADYLTGVFSKKKKQVQPAAYGNIIINTSLCAVLLYLSVNIYNNSLYRDVLNNRFRETGFGVNDKYYPAEMMEFIREEKINQIGGRPFNNLRLGGYLIWTLPGTQNFIDSRNLNNDIMAAYNIIDQRKAGYEDKLKAYGIDYVMYSEPYLSENAVGIEKNLLAYLTRSPDWKLVFWDDKSLLFVKNEEKFLDIINKFGYKYLTPENIIFNKKQWVSASQLDRERFLLEVKRKIKEEKTGKLINNLIREMNLTNLNP